VLRASRDLIECAPDDLCICDVLTHAPPDPAFPAELRGKPVAIVGAVWTGDHDEGAARARPAGRRPPAGRVGSDSGLVSGDSPMRTGACPASLGI